MFLPAHRESQQRTLTARELRKMIPTVALLRTMTSVALCGVYPRLDPHTGEEIAPAQPVSQAESVAAAKYLLDKALPALKSEEDPKDAGFDRTKLRDLTKDDIKRMTKAEVEAALEASFTLETSAHASTDPTGEPAGSPPSAAEPTGHLREGADESAPPDRSPGGRMDLGLGAPGGLPDP